MGNSHSAPRDGGERLPEYLKRVFKNNTKDVDKLAAQALEEEQKQRKKEQKKQKGFWKRLKRKLKADERSCRHDTPSEDFLPEQNENAEVDCHHGNTETRQRRNSNSDCAEQTSDMDNVISFDIITTEGKTNHGVTSTSIPRRLLQTEKSLTFQFYIPPKSGWTVENSNRRSVRDMSRGLEAPWTHKDYGSDTWSDDLACGSDDNVQAPEHVTCDTNKSEKGRDLLSKDLEQQQEKKDNTVEKYTETTEENLNAFPSEWSVLLEKPFDVYYGFKKIDEELERPRNKQSFSVDRNETRNDNDYCIHFEHKKKMHIPICEEIDNSSFTQKIETESFSTPYNKESDTNNEKFTVKKSENCGYCQTNQSYLGLTRIERYYAQQKLARRNYYEVAPCSIFCKKLLPNDGSRGLPAEKTTPPQRMQSDIPVAPLSVKNKTANHVSHAIALPDVLDVTNQHKDVSVEKPLPRLEGKRRSMDNSKQNTIYDRPVIHYHKNYKQNELRKQNKTYDNPVLHFPEQCKQNELESTRLQVVREQSNRSDHRGITPGNNDQCKADVSDKASSSFVSKLTSRLMDEDSKMHDREQITNKVNQFTQTDSNSADKRTEERRINEIKPACKDVQTVETKCTDIGTDNSCETNETRKMRWLQNTDDFFQSKALKAEAFFMPCGPSALNDTKYNDSDKEYPGKEYQDNLKRQNERKNEYSLKIRQDIKNEKQNDNITDNMKKAKGETFFVSFGPSTLNDPINNDDATQKSGGKLSDRKKQENGTKAENCSKIEDETVRQVSETDKSRTDNKKAEAFFVSFGPSKVPIHNGDGEPKFESRLSNIQKKQTNPEVDNTKNAKLSKPTKMEIDEKQTHGKKAEAFFVSFGSSKSSSNGPSNDVKTNFENSFQSKVQPTSLFEAHEETPIKTTGKEQKSLFEVHEDTPIKTSGNIFTKFFSFAGTDHAGNSCEKKATEKKRENKASTGGTEYGSVEHHNQTREDNILRKKKLDQIQTKVDSWKSNDTNESCLNSTLRNFEISSKPAQYGSVAHNNLIKKDNAIRKQRIQSMQTKVDSWKTNEEDDSYLQPEMRNYKLAPKPAQYGSVEHNNMIKHDNALRKKKIDSIETTLDTWKTNEPDYSYLNSRMRKYELAPKQAEYGSVRHYNQIKKDNSMRKMRIDKIQTNLDTWNAPNPGSKYSLKRKDEWEPVLDHKKYGTAAHYYQLKSNNAMRQKRLSNIRSNLDTWNAPNPGSKYSLKRRDEWEPVLDHKKYGTAAHYYQVKNDNAMRQKRLSQIQSNLDTWNAPNPGSKYSLKRKDEWEPVYDTKKYGSVAHYHQVRETHAENRYMLKKASTRINTWQPKSKMELLHKPHHETDDMYSRHVESRNSSLTNARPQKNSGFDSSVHNNHSLSAWSRHDTERNREAKRSYIPVRKGSQLYRDAGTHRGVLGQFH